MMPSKTVRVTLEIPDGVSPQVREAIQSRTEEVAVLALWEAGELSTRRAAEELGLSYRDFLDLLATRSIPVERGEINLKAIEEAQRRLAKERPE
jgi:predicted HTH domain antitoxin